MVCKLQAGGSGFNTVVVINQTSSNSCILGNYFCASRQVPPQNVLYINWSGGNTSWTSNNFQTNLVIPLLSMLAARQLTNQIDCIVLSMDIPFQTSFGTNNVVNGTTSALFYGLRLGNPSDTNSYAASETSFGQATLVGAPGYSFLTTMITADSLAQAEALVNQGVISDGTLPQAPVVLAKSSDPSRNIRYPYFDNAIFNVNILGVSSILRTNTDSVSWPNSCLGYETGLAQFSVLPGTFVPGAVADSLTSYGGVIFGSNDQTNLLAFINAGAAGSYGTVAEPGADTQEFPNPQVYFYQARGFSLAESYYQSINEPYLGLIVAEPLAAPFARPGVGRWSTNLPNSVLSGTSMLSVKFSAHDGNHPLQQIDLFVDGTYFSTLTNLAPCPGNLLTVTLNGYPITYTVPTNATLNTIATGLAALINAPAATNATQVVASVYGDRIELQSIATNPVTVPFYVADDTPTNTPGLSYSVNYLSESSPPQMIPDGLDRSGAFTMQVGIPSSLPYVIQASTDLVGWLPIFTNAMAGLLNFIDFDSTNYPARFYRMTWPVPDQPPILSAPGIVGNGAFQMHVDSVPGLPWAIQVSSNLIDWATVATNQSGGAMDFVDTNAASYARRYYRACLVSPAPPSFTVLNEATNLTLVRVDGALQPYVVGVSTNQGQLTVLETNFAIGQIQTTAASAIGSANGLSTFLTASQPAFLASGAFGMQEYSVFSNSLPANSWIQFTFIKTNGQIVFVGVTNQTAGNSGALTTNLFSAINANPALQGSDGVVAGDYVVNQYGTFSYIFFNLYARSPGYQAAAIQVIPQPSTSVNMPSAPQGPLTNNLSDLQPRNHLYVTAGATSLALTFPLDTTTLADGYHELTAVAYEGSNVRTETAVTAPVVVQNSPLSATLTLLDLTNQAPAQGTYHIQVAANTNTVSLITLFSTGGALGMATNVPTAIFQVNGTNLWDGLHPFYALVETSDGLQYRTGTSWIQLGAVQ
ncbi:MAG: TIGR03790 family protein [Verrucomicrobiia bacterium]